MLGWMSLSFACSVSTLTQSKQAQSLITLSSCTVSISIIAILRRYFIFFIEHLYHGFFFFFLCKFHLLCLPRGMKSRVVSRIEFMVLVFAQVEALCQRSS